MGCRFCRTATIGFKRNLTLGEIISQITMAKQLPNRVKLKGKKKRVTNIVFMGMGEPLDNPERVLASLDIMTSPKYLAIGQNRVSLSTVGVIPALKKLIEKGGLHGGLTISLSSAKDEVRDQIMPINKVWPLGELKEVLTAFPLHRGDRISIAYVLLEGVNDSPQDAKDLSRFLTGLKTKINLIPFNPWPGAPFNRPSEKAIADFKSVLVEKFHTVLTRETRGDSINAACGLLVASQTTSEPSVSSNP
jgi:23S rRNA (adenine2503-C2)-methyltransferase